MFKKHKYDIVVYSTGYMRLVLFFFAGFIILLGSTVERYVVEKDAINISIVLSIAFIIIFGGITVLIYSVCGDKIYISKEKIIAKRWYGLRKKFEVKDINKVIFEVSKGEAITAQIVVNNFSNKYVDEQENFEKLVDYLIVNVDREKIVCYVFGTKKETKLKDF